MGGKNCDCSFNQGAAEIVVPKSYTTGFRNRMIERMTGPTAISANALSREVGVSQGSLSRWLLQAPTLGAMTASNQPGSRGRTSKSSQQWSAAEKLEAVIEASAISDADLGAFLRRKGLTEADLNAWRMLATDALGEPTKKQRAKAAADARRIEQLEQKVTRTERRLSGAKALLDLQKKVQEIWGDADAPTAESKES